MSVEFSRRVVADLDEIQAYYRKVANREVASAFERRFNAVVERITSHPETLPRVRQRPGTRVALMITYPYEIFFRIVGPDRIRILHVRHTARRPWEPA